MKRTFFFRRISRLIQKVRDTVYAATHATKLLADLDNLGCQNSGAEEYIRELQEDRDILRTEVAQAIEQRRAYKDELIRLFRSLSACKLEIGMAQRMYEVVRKSFDSDTDSETGDSYTGEILYSEATKIWGEFNYEAHLLEEFCGEYFGATRLQMFEHLRADIWEDTEMFRSEEDQIYRNALVKMGLLQNNQYAIPAKKLIPLLCSENVSPSQAKQLYEANFKKLDAAGFKLFHAAELILGEFSEAEFYYEANRGAFECMDGFTRMKFLLVQHQEKLGNQKFGRWIIEPGCACERCTDFSMDTTTPEYQQFEEQLYTSICRELKLTYPRAVLEAELRLRMQEAEAGEDLGYRNPLVSTDYSNEMIQSVIDAACVATGGKFA